MNDFDPSAGCSAAGSSARETQNENSSDSQTTQTSDSESDTPRKAPKKMKRMCRFRESWKTTYACITPVNSNVYRANCTRCKREFGIGHGGEGDIKIHMSSESHKQAERVVKQNSIMEKFMISSKNTGLQDEVMAAEMSMVYHSVNHSHSYRSLDCTLKLLPVVFNDSNKASKISCGRTKAEAIVANVLAPYSQELIVNDLSKNYAYFSLSSDASNKGNTKLFPVVLRYFQPSVGVVTRLLDFYEDSDETAAAISEKIVDVVQKNNLNMQMVSAYSADNASINFGKHKGVYKKLCAANERILPAGCPAHILHNTAKKACDVMDYDVESLVLKVYNHFSISAKRAAQLKEMFNFVDIEWSQLLRHVPTRWLSLFPAIDRLLKNWPAVKAYFQTMGKEETPAIIWRFIGDESGEASDEDTPSVPVLYLYFLQNCLPVFQTAILSLERSNLVAVEVFDILSAVRDKLLKRQADKFFGFHVGKAMKKLPAQQSKKLESQFLAFYKKALTYLDQWFDFSETNYMNKIRCLNLKQPLIFDDLLSVVESLKLQASVSIDELYEEYSAISQHLLPYTESRDDDFSCDAKWAAAFQKAGIDNVSNLLNIVSFVMSIPASNAAVERVFSLMESFWSDARNRCSTELIRAELQVKMNFDMDCQAFHKFVKGKKELLRCAANDNKYKYKYRH